MRIIACIITIMIMISGCQVHPRSASSAPPAAPTAEPAVTMPVTIKPVLTTTEYWTPPDIPLTADLPTYPPEPSRRLSETQIPQEGPNSLRLLAGALEATGDPTAVAHTGARYIGSMAGGRHVYLLTVEPTLDAPKAYIVQKEAEGWTATPICPAMPDVWFWPGTAAMAGDPVVICAHTNGTDAIMDVVAYRSGQTVLAATGLHKGTLTVRDRPDGPPDIIVTGGLIWLAIHLEPQVTERFTFTWRDGAYRLASHDRMADETYHLARFTALVAKGDYARAEAEFAPGDVEAYLQAHAPHFREAACGLLSTRGYRNYLAAGVDGSGPWFRFTFGPDGRLRAIEETGPPKP